MSKLAVAIYVKVAYGNFELTFLFHIENGLRKYYRKINKIDIFVRNKIEIIKTDNIKFIYLKIIISNSLNCEEVESVILKIYNMDF